MQKSILLIGNHLSHSGQNTGIGEVLAQKLTERGWSVLLTSCQMNKVFRLLDMLTTIYQKRNTYAAAQIDVFSGQAFLWACLSGGVLQSLRKPFVLTLHGGNLPKYAETHPKRVKKLFSQAKIVTSPSNYLIKQMSQYRSDIRLIPNGIELEKYPSTIREQPQPHLIWLRAFHSIYNPSMAARMLAELKQTGIEAELTMIGPDKGDGSLQNLIEVAIKLGVKDQIRINPGIPKEQVPHTLAKGDIFINTTNIDNTPVSVIEALACGLCVVSTNVGGLPYLLEDGVDALLVPPDDPQAMAAAVRRILTEPGLAAKLSANARKKALQYDWSVVIPQWEALFEEVINTK